VPSRTLADLIAFNKAHATEEMPIFGQELFEMAEARGPLSDEKYQKALATLQRCADAEGLAALLAQQDVEALLAPSNGPADRIDEVWEIAAATVAGRRLPPRPPSPVTEPDRPGRPRAGAARRISFVGNRSEDGFLLAAGPRLRARRRGARRAEARRLRSALPHLARAAPANWAVPAAARSRFSA